MNSFDKSLSLDHFLVHLVISTNVFIFLTLRIHLLTATFQSSQLRGKLYSLLLKCSIVRKAKLLNLTETKSANNNATV